MSFGLASKRNIQSKLLSAQTVSTPRTYVRNPSWPVLPTVISTDNKFVGLHKVDVDSNFVALSAEGAYTVDWGDGTSTENIATGIIAQHLYAATGLANTNAPVTLTDTGDLVTRTAHGYSNGNTVSFYNIVNTTGLIEAQIYYVISATPNTFQVSETFGGSAVALTTNGTATLLPYKLAIVTVTPQVGQSFTSINLNKKHTQPNLGKYSSGFLDIIIAGSLLTTIQIGSESAISLTQNILFSSLKQANIVICNVPIVSYLFYECSSLENVKYSNTSTYSGASQNSMFFGCSSLTTVPLFNTAAVRNMSNMFSGCSSLTTVPLFNTAAVTTMSSMFSGCRALNTVPLFNTDAVRNMTSMFSGCSSLTTVPLFNTAAVTTMSSMFSDCFSLTTVPLFNTAAMGSQAMNSMFFGCSSLTTVPLFNTAAVTSMANMFFGCSSLTTVPLFNTAAVTSMSSMFFDCRALNKVPLFNTDAVTSMADMFSGCASLSKATLSGTKFNISYVGCKLSEIELNSIMDNLATVSASFQTLTITQNWGAVAPIVKAPYLDSSGSGFVGTTNTSTTINADNTSGIMLGMQWTGVGSPVTSPAVCTIAASTTTAIISRTAHGLSNGDEVSFASLLSVTGVIINKIYYVVAATTNNFQVAPIPGGTSITLTTTLGTGVTIRYRSIVTSVVSNLTITVSRPATVTGSNALSYRTLKTQTASLKGWGVSG